MNELHIIYNWKQAEQIKKEVLGRTTRNTQKTPAVWLEWYFHQGEIEWHNAAHSQWKKLISSHMQVKKEYNVNYDIFHSKQIMVVWNAQKMSEIEWSIWKDIKNDLQTIFVSDRFIPITRTFGMKVKHYPQETTSLLDTKKMEMCVNGLIQKEWRYMIDFRDLIISYMEWNDSFIPIQRSLIDILMNKMIQKKVSKDKKHLFMCKILKTFPQMNTKIECMMKCERALVLFLKIIDECK